MTITYQLKLSNREVYRLFTRKIQGHRLFYAAVIQKIQVIKRQASESAEAGKILEDIQERISTLCNEFYDDIDALEGALEKKQYVGDLDFHFEKPFKVMANFDSPPAAALVELFTIYDRLISLLNLTQLTRQTKVKDLSLQMREYFKKINRLMSQIILIKKRQ